jgi:hypothetical protein
MTDYAINCDIELIQELLEISRSELSAACGISLPTLNRWVKDPVQASAKNLENFYSYAYNQGLRINAIKAQLYLQEHTNEKRKVLFHGSKSGIEGPLSIDLSRSNNDFGKGFYCGESFTQSAMFVAKFRNSSAYILTFDTRNLRAANYSVDTNWMMTIALYRKRLTSYASHPLLKELQAKVENADYIVAPIADNRMYEIIDSFAEGYLTDEQCKHALCATDLGNQYVFKTNKALTKIKFLEHCFLCEPEKEALVTAREASSRIGQDKVKAAKREFRNKGHYIDEVLQ